MGMSRNDQAIPAGTFANSGQYMCTACGYYLQLADAGDLPTCPKDDGLHSFKEWQPVSSEDDCDPTLPNSPNHQEEKDPSI